MRLVQELSATWLDVLALLMFAGGWIAYAAFAERHGKTVPSLHNRMDLFRREWMLRMIYHREFESKTLKAMLDEDSSPAPRV